MLTKLKSFKNDIAPIGFYFDIFSTDLFKIPVMPVPMRIDKISNGNACLFILPNVRELNQLGEELGFQINFKRFYSEGIRNLTNYAKKTYKELVYKDLDPEKIIQWFNKSKNISGTITSLTIDFTFLISEFLKLYAVLSKSNFETYNDNYVNELIRYCDKVIEYFQKIIEQNVFKVIENDSPQIKKLYRVKKDKYYPLIIPIKVEELTTNKTKTRGFIPYLIYDDILDCFSYNRDLLTEKTQTLCDHKIWIENRIIISRLEGKPLSDEIIKRTFTFVIIYFMTFILGSYILLMLGIDLTSSVGAVATCLGGIGPGLGSVGPTGTYLHIPAVGKWVLSFIMLLGRLELFTVLLLFTKVMFRDK